MYYSTFNITNANKNNTFSYTWVNGVTYNVNIPDSLLDVDGLNNYLHFTMVQNKHYIVSSTGDYVYLMTLGINPTRYAVQLNCFGISVALAAANAWVLPVGATWVLPTNFIVPALIVPPSANNNFGLVIGYSPGSYPDAVIAGVPPAQTQLPAYTSDQEFLSTFTPQVTPISSFVLTCSLINNNYAVPNNLIYSFSPQGNIGEQMLIQPNQYVFIDVNVALSGENLTTALNSVTVLGTANVSLNGENLTTILNSVGISADGNVSIPVFENPLSLSLGVVDPSPDVDLIGQQATLSLNSVSIEVGVEVPLTGENLTTTLDSVTAAISINVDVTGQSLTGTTGQLYVTAWAPVDPGQSINYTGVNTGQTINWTDVAA
jgi:hypothetical protein